MKRAVSAALAALLVLALCPALAGCGSKNPKNFKVGFVLPGPAEGGLWEQAQNEGRKYMEAQLGVTTMLEESVPEDATCKARIESLVSKGCKVIFAAGQGYQSFVLDIAKKHPNVIFEICSPFASSGKNLGSYFGREYQAYYLAGIASGAATKTNKIGFAGSEKNAVSLLCADAFALGALAVNPEAKVDLVWTGSRFDPDLEKLAAGRLLADGCDVVAQRLNTPSALEAAVAEEALGCGSYLPLGRFAKTGYLTSPVLSFGSWFVYVVQGVMNSTFQPTNVWAGIDTGLVGLDELGEAVPQKARDLIEQKRKSMADGSWDVFTGPITDSAGTTRAADGVRMSDADLLLMDFLVQNSSELAK